LAFFIQAAKLNTSKVARQVTAMMQKLIFFVIHFIYQPNDETCCLFVSMLLKITSECIKYDQEFKKCYLPA
jgi:hypothetical protein